MVVVVQRKSVRTTTSLNRLGGCFMMIFNLQKMIAVKYKSKLASPGGITLNFAFNKGGLTLNFLLIEAATNKIPFFLSRMGSSSQTALSL